MSTYMIDVIAPGDVLFKQNQPQLFLLFVNAKLTKQKTERQSLNYLRLQKFQITFSVLLCLDTQSPLD